MLVSSSSARIAGLLMAAICAASLRSQFSVQSVVPANEVVGAATSADVVLTFNAQVAPASVTPTAVRVFGRWSGVVDGVLSVGAGGNTIRFRPSRPYFPGERVTVAVSNAVTSGTGQPLTGGFMAGFWARSAPASGTFALAQVVSYRRAGEGLVRTYGFYAGDLDRDGSPDMSAANEVSSDVRVLLNDGCGNYPAMQVAAMPAGEEPSPSEGADFDGDGFCDLVTGNQNGNSISVFRNDGAGGYLAPLVTPAGGSVHGVAVVDADGDGDADVLASNLVEIRLFLNDGLGNLTFASSFDGGGSGEWQIAVADADGDGIGDLFVANRGGGVSLLLGNGAGGYTLSAVRATPSSLWALALGDIDGDGNVDAIATNNSTGAAVVVRGDGAGGLLPAVNYPVGSAPVSVDLADLEGDGDLDLAVSNFGSANCTVYFNDGSGTFGNSISLSTTQAASCSVLVDDDRDGDIDILVTDELADDAHVYRQVGPNPQDVQQKSCASSLRIDGFAMRAGFGGRPPHPVAIDTNMFVNVSGAPNAPFILLLGNAATPGLVFPEGRLNLGAPIAVVLAAGPAGTTDVRGESLLPIYVPNGMPLGVPLTFQAAVANPQASFALVLGNPEQVVFTP